MLRIDALGDAPAFAAALSDAANAMRRGEGDDGDRRAGARATRARRCTGGARLALALGDRAMTAEFVFATAQYESGDWDSAPLVPPNIIDTIARYTEIDVAPTGVVVPLERRSDAALSAALSHRPSAGAVQRRRAAQRASGSSSAAACCSSTTTTTTSTACFTRRRPKRSRARSGRSTELPNDHPLYSAFFKFDGPPTTSHELNGWGDNLVHKHLLAVQRNGRIAVLYSSKDYSSEWNYHPDSKRFLSVDNTRFAVNLVVYALTA